MSIEIQAPEVPPPTTFNLRESVPYLRLICAARESIARTECLTGPILTTAQRDELPRLRAHLAGMAA